MDEDVHDASERLIERGRLRGRLAMHVVVIGVAVLFIGSSTWQIVRAVFALGVAPVTLSTARATRLDETCAVGIRLLSGALDRAATKSTFPATPTLDRGEESPFRAALSPEWDRADAVSKACATSSEGLDAWASLERLRSAEERLALRGQNELEPLKRDLEAHLPADLR